MEYDQYKKAYPKLDFDGPHEANKGYGWAGNGYGWQLDSKAYSFDDPDGPLPDDSDDEVVEEEIKVQKVDKVQSFFGEPGSGLRYGGEEQDFYKLRDAHLANGTLFEDPQFPCDNQSVYFSHRPNYHIEWRRPQEIVSDARLFVEGFSRFDVQQGELGDCWLLAAVANLTMYHRLFFQVVPDDQSFDENYAGIFHFRFWQYGRWIDIVIDDRLPTRHGELLFLRSTTQNEFWSALLEKAYAKLHGSYEALKGGSTCEAMEDFTGGVTEMYELNSAPADLFKIMLKAYDRGSLMGSSIEPDPNEFEAKTRDGLVKGHAYSITKVKFVEIHTPNTSGKIPLLRLRNPWGDSTEWNGAWSDQSPEWRFIPEEEKQHLGLNFDDDGEFWMSFKDFVSRFDRVELCNLNPDTLDEGSAVKRWQVSYFEGAWKAGVTAGGCRNFIDTFASNPQYRINLTETDDDENDGKCTIIVALMQKNRRSQRRMGLEELSIGFVLYYLRDPANAPKPLDRNFFKHNPIVARCPSYINLREVTCRFRLPPGTYCIVPSTFDPNEEGDFLLRLFSEKQNNMEKHDADIGTISKHIQDTPQDENELLSNHLRDIFLAAADVNGELNWRQLQTILRKLTDEVSQNELPFMNKTATSIDAAPNLQTQTNPDIVEQLVSLVIGLLCIFCENKEEQRGNETKPDEVPLEQQIQKVNEGESCTVFGDDVCRSLLTVYDTDRSGMINLNEFKVLWNEVSHWMQVFQQFDRDGTRTLDGFELRQALNAVGLTVNNTTLNTLVVRFGDKGCLHFDAFITVIIKLKHALRSYQNTVDRVARPDISVDDYINSILYT